MHADSEGVIFEADMPVSFDAFRRVEQSMEERGLHPYVRDGSGGDLQCKFRFGPFTELEEAKKIIEELRKSLSDIYTNERKYVDKFSQLEGEYPLGPS